MAYQAPTAGQALGDVHLQMHKTYDCDENAPAQSVKVDSNGKAILQVLGLYIATVEVTLTGGSATETFDVTISANLFSAKPASGLASHSGSTMSDLIMAKYDYGSASNSATNARFVAYLPDGTNLSAGTYRFSIILGTQNT